MKLIKPCGRSTTTPPKGACAPGTQRRLVVRDAIKESSGKDNAQSGPQDIKEYTKSKPEAVIAHWISVIDKIIPKTIYENNKELEKVKGKEKKEKQKRRHKEIEANRKALGDACWEHISLTAEQKKEYKPLWEQKIKAVQSGRKFIRDTKGRWYKTFVSDGSEEQDFTAQAEEIAKRIKEHLYNNALRINYPKDKSGNCPAYTSGIIPHRAQAITENSLINAYRNRKGNIFSAKIVKEKEDEKIKAIYDKIAREFYEELKGELCKRLEEQRKKEEQKREKKGKEAKQKPRGLKTTRLKNAILPRFLQQPVSRVTYPNPHKTKLAPQFF